MDDPLRRRSSLQQEGRISPPKTPSAAVKSEGGRFQTSASGNPAADSQAGCEANAIEESDVSYAFKEENGGSPSQSVQSPGTGGPSVMASPGTAETSVIAVDASELAEASGCHPTPASALQAQGGSSGGGRCLADTFSERFQAEATKLSLAQTYPTTRVSFRAVARNPALAKAAQAELGCSQEFSRTAIEDSDEGAQTAAHAPDINQQRATLDALDTDVREEATVNQELVSMLVGRLEFMRRSSERCLGACRAFAGAEASYALGLATASQIPLTTDSDSEALTQLLSAFRALPQAVSSVHAEIRDGLMATTKRVQLLVTHLRRECSMVAATCSRAATAIDNARRQLRVSFLIHQEALRTVEQSEASRIRSRGAAWSFSTGNSPHRGGSATSAAVLTPTAASPVALDPWATEANLVAQLAEVAAAQNVLRSAMADAAGRLRDLECRRVTAIKGIVCSFLSSYPAALLPDVASSEAVAAMAEEVDPHSGAGSLEAVAEAVRSSSARLADRQEGFLAAVQQELMCSPEIVRQGELAVKVTSRGEWSTCHFVLTRSCFLHWFTSVDQLSTLDGVSLARCQFDGGTDSTFQIVEKTTPMLHALEWLYAAVGRPRSRCLTMRSLDVNDSCEWAIAIRELMATASGHT